MEQELGEQLLSSLLASKVRQDSTKKFSQHQQHSCPWYIQYNVQMEQHWPLPAMLGHWPLCPMIFCFTKTVLHFFPQSVHFKFNHFQASFKDKYILEILFDCFIYTNQVGPLNCNFCHAWADHGSEIWWPTLIQQGFVDNSAPDASFTEQNKIWLASLSRVDPQK